MPEQISPQSIERMNQTAESYQLVEMLTDDVLLKQDRERLQADIDGNPNLKHFADLESARNEATVRMYAAQREGRNEDAAMYNSAVDDLGEEQNDIPVDDKKQYHDIQQSLRYIDNFRARVVEPDSVEAIALIKAMKAAPPVHPVTKTEAPFKDYKDNTESTWKYADPETIREFVADRLFFDPNSAGVSTDGKNQIIIKAQPGEVIDIPSDLLVYAQGFDSWNGREGNGSYKDVAGPYAKNYDRKIHSSDVIKHYASLITELPPVSEVRVFVQPDGTMFADNGGGDSHRIAAAILRGEQAIRAESVSFVALEKNIVQSRTLAHDIDKK